MNNSPVTSAPADEPGSQNDWSLVEWQWGSILCAFIDVSAVVQEPQGTGIVLAAPTDIGLNSLFNLGYPIRALYLLLPRFNTYGFQSIETIKKVSEWIVEPSSGMRITVLECQSGARIAVNTDGHYLLGPSSTKWQDPQFEPLDSKGNEEH